MASHKTALVLSAGGLYCAWQAGAWKAISEHIQPDLVVGTSAGALNGWPIAGGCSPDTMIERWLDPSSSDVLHLGRHRFDPAPLRMQTERLVAEFEPRIPFGVTLVELPRLRTVLFQHPHVTARHLQATCAIPVVLPSVKIDGTRYVDGGLVEKIPLHAAAAMGATRIIALDCLPPLNVWWLRIGAGTVRFLKGKRTLPPNVEILTIAPPEPMGDANSAVFWKRENIECWIALGFRDATNALRTGSLSKIHSESVR